MGKIVVKCEVVLELEREDMGNGATVLFTRNDPDNDERILDVEMDRAHWRDMGEPKRVTVTVRPGDFLNTEGLPDL